MAPGSIFIILIFQYLVISFAFLLCLYFTLHLYNKNTKNIILSSLSDLTLVSDREGIDNPFIALVARFLFVCVGAWDLSVDLPGNGARNPSCYLLSMRWFSLEEERVMQQSRVSISLGLRTKVSI